MEFQYDALEPAFVSGSIQDRLTNQATPVESFITTRLPLSAFPAWLVNQPNVRSIQIRSRGLNIMQAYARAQGMTDASMDNVVTATGELNTLVYGDVLRARGVVGVRGAGFSYSGLYYVKSVTHMIREGEYRQKFTLTRDGLGSITPVVVP
jgi:hypothetical protein